MAKPVVVIVGRSNVGKSTLFNRITKTKSAIVEDLPGVTRDRNYIDAEWDNKKFTVVDTGGFYLEPPDEIFSQVKEHALFAIEEGDVIIHLLDGKEGLKPSDFELAKLLRSSGKKVLWVVNKIDAPSREDRIIDFYSLGVDKIWPISALTGYGYDDFMEHLTSILPSSIPETSEFPKVAVVGRPNVGKSTLINTLIGKKRMIVSATPGTTRDSIDTVCTYYGKKYILIDTAGLRKKGKIGYSIERFAMIRALRSIQRCDIALLVLDANEGVVEQDKQIANIVNEYGKGAIFLLNKWDMVEDPEFAYKRLINELYRKIWFMDYVPALTISAIEKKRVTKIFPIIDEIISERKKRIPTPQLNKYFEEVLSTINLPLYKGKQVKMYYITQVEIEPPTFIIFCNYPSAIKDTYIRYMEKILRSKFTFKGTPVKIYIKQKDFKNEIS
jgi:GTP-binding protein